MKPLLLVFFMGLIGASIGWITNVFAIRLLFRPYECYKVPVLGFQFQGLIPKRKMDIAESLGDIVSLELITGNDIALTLGRPDIKEKLAFKVQEHVQERVLNKLPFMIPPNIQLVVAEYVGKMLGQEVIKFLDHPQKAFHQNEIEDIKIEIKNIVKNKISSLDMERLELITYAVASRELKHIEVLGGILGFLIGLIQGIVVLTFPL